MGESQIALRPAAMGESQIALRPAAMGESQISPEMKTPVSAGSTIWSARRNLRDLPASLTL
jgi:hypothetical protein